MIVPTRGRGVTGVLDVVTGMLTVIRRRRRGVRVVVASGVVVDGVVVIARRTLMARVAGVTRGIRVGVCPFLCVWGFGLVDS
ncbi:hypothetical protein [Microbacterium sp. PAMC22086]|uniref:hypothetical protein n=1 Tax=Microbacterium sp. PAMC22086 TaxID=2861281 RepID=UPI001C630831|nr:hypothetical protein [Microbacterium sp. PAMC22086]QYG12423.1 hypothetical protein KY497_03830 [Microbacterium sp. PAMC22086]